MQFNLVICGLDSIEARRWMSATLVNLVDPENPESLKPMIDGGTEGTSITASTALDVITIPRRLQGTSPCHPSHRHFLL